MLSASAPYFVARYICNIHIYKEDTELLHTIWGCLTASFYFTGSFCCPVVRSYSIMSYGWFSSEVILNSYATSRFDPECEPHLDEVLNQESIHCS